MNLTQKSVQDIVVRVFIVGLMVINWLLTFMFGGTYGADTFPTQYAVVSFALGGLALSFFYDFAAIGWFMAYNRDGQSKHQRGIAFLLAMASILASTVVSAIHLGMTTTLVDIGSWHEPIGFVGLIMMVIMATLHFVSIFAYFFFDPSAREQDAKAELQAQLAQFQQDARVQIGEKTMNRTKQLMLQNIDTIAEQNGNDLWGTILPSLVTNRVPLVGHGNDEAPPVVLNPTQEPILRKSNESNPKYANGKAEKDSPFQR